MLKTKDVLKYLFDNFDCGYVLNERRKGINQFADKLIKEIDCSHYCATKAIFEFPYYIDKLCEAIYE